MCLNITTSPQGLHSGRSLPDCRIKKAVICFLDAAADHHIKTRKNWVPASSDEDLVMRLKPQNKVYMFVCDLQTLICLSSPCYCMDCDQNLLGPDPGNVLKSAIDFIQISPVSSELCQNVWTPSKWAVKCFNTQTKPSFKPNNKQKEDQTCILNSQ